MQARSAAAGLAAIAVLCCTGCGSTHAAQPTTVSTTHVAKIVRRPLTLPSAASLVIVPPLRGAGNEQFGTFTASGTVYFEFSCKGQGPLTIAGILEHISPCDGSPTGAAVPYHAGERVRVAVRAKPGTTWRLAVGEHVPGTARVLVHSSGVGNKSFGTFLLGGTILFDMACKGKGNLDIFFDPIAGKPISGEGTVCPEPASLVGSLGLGREGKGRTARISVYADPNVRWTIRLSATNG
jgi:hypothetical protein